MSSSVSSQSQRKRREVRLSDLIFFHFLRGIGGLVIGLFLLLIYFLYKNSQPILDLQGLSFFWNPEWSPTQDVYGALSFAWGTLASSAIALMVAVPLSLAAALFLTELGPKWVRAPFRFFMEMLAAIPSVVYGLWGIFVLVPYVRTVIQPILRQHSDWMPLFSGPPFGVGLFTAGLILGIMITPTITSFSVEVFRSIPPLYREGAMALGATSWETIRLAVLKPARAGVFAAVILGLGRAMGETMAVAMVIGNRAEISFSLFSPSATMSSVIANEYAEANLGLHLNALVAVGFGLLIVSLIINGLARVIIWNLTRFRK
ncbi:MAG: phosphate ABC transporter permease subunit PstC [Proteobacteria bacterium]|jgi:phosphate transport system permease protein|nr:phosphate ABC transporter permease subunit PstC [Pseudomonadota bacterium]